MLEHSKLDKLFWHEVRVNVTHLKNHHCCENGYFITYFSKNQKINRFTCKIFKIINVDISTKLSMRDQMHMYIT